MAKTANLYARIEPEVKEAAESILNTLGIPAIILPLVNPDNNQHSPNENLRLGQINYGLQVFYSLLSTEIN